MNFFWTNTIKKSNENYGKIDLLNFKSDEKTCTSIVWVWLSFKLFWEYIRVIWLLRLFHFDNIYSLGSTNRQPNCDHCPNSRLLEEDPPTGPQSEGKIRDARLGYVIGIYTQVHGILNTWVRMKQAILNILVSLFHIPEHDNLIICTYKYRKKCPIHPHIQSPSVNDSCHILITASTHDAVSTKPLSSVDLKEHHENAWLQATTQVV